MNGKRITSDVATGTSADASSVTPDPVQRSHWVGCETVHHACALGLLDAERARAERAERERDSYKREAGLLADALNNIQEMLPDQDPGMHTSVKKIESIDGTDYDCDGDGCTMCLIESIDSECNRGLLAIRAENEARETKP